jgi:hypothetical protein
MNQNLWLVLLVTFLSGGAMGALIRLLYDLRHGKVQTVLHRVSVFPLFRHEAKSDLMAVVSITYDELTTDYRTLFVGDFALRNTGNRDYEEFEFGVALDSGQCIHTEWKDPDQHHALSLVEAASPSSPRSGLKFRLKPFNRNDSYSLRLYLVPGEEGLEPGSLRLTSPHAIRFAEESERVARRHLVAGWTLALILLLLNVVLASWLFKLEKELHKEIVPTVVPSVKLEPR